MADVWTVSADYKELSASLPSVAEIRNTVVDANATALVWHSWHCAVADARFKNIIDTTNRQKIGLKGNCSPELCIILFRSSLEDRKYLLYISIDCRDICLIKDEYLG